MDEPIPPTPEMIEKETYLRLAADFDNYRKDAERRIREAADYGKNAVLQECAELKDDIPKAIPWEDLDEKGYRMLEKKLADLIERNGWKRIETLGKSFDPTTMEALQMVEGGPSHTVKEELQAGYQLGDRVIRPARVIIYQ